jgi:hypothetical protein
MLRTSTQNRLPCGADLRREERSPVAHQLQGFLVEDRQVDPGVVTYYQTRTNGEWGGN